MTFRPLLAAASLIAFCTASISAQAAASREEYLTGYAGWFDLIDQDDQSAQFGVEYRMKPLVYGIRPTVGVSITTDAAIYGYGGLNWEIELMPSQLYLIPNFMVGAYGQGHGKDLGGALEFRSGLELDYQLPNMHCVGVSFNHISNASIYDKNPGAETLLVNYSIPFSAMMGR